MGHARRRHLAKLDVPLRREGSRALPRKQYQQPGQLLYYTNYHDFTWVTVHLDTVKVVRDSIARLKVSRDADNLDKRSAVVEEHPAGRPLDAILRQEGHMCGAEDPPLYVTERGILYQQKDDQLVMSLSGVSRSLPWKNLRVTLSGVPLDCENGPCSPSVALRIGKRELLVFSIPYGGEAFIVAPKDQLDQKRSQLLNEAGFEAHKKGDYQTSARLFIDAVGYDSGNRTALYNAACAQARLGAGREPSPCRAPEGRVARAGVYPKGAARPVHPPGARLRRHLSAALLGPCAPTPHPSTALPSFLCPRERGPAARASSAAHPRVERVCGGPLVNRREHHRCRMKSTAP
jgi:hypothetical protein